jgi:glycosyltransferase involved in cell wall biosynthesis
MNRAAASIISFDIISQEMKVLWLTYDLPYPLHSGGKLRAYHLIKGLSENHQIDLFSFIRSEDQLQYLPKLKKYCQKIETFKRPVVWSPRNVLRAGFSTLPFAAATYYFRSARDRVLKMAEEGGYDLVHFESFYPAVYLPFIKSLGSKVLMGSENVEYRVYQRFAEQQRFPPARWFLSIDILKMKKFEEKLWRLADVNVAPSGDDADVISQVTEKKCYVVPNAVDSGSFSKIKKNLHQGLACLFVGDFTYLTNRDAVRWLVEDVLSTINNQQSTINLLLVGRNPTDYIKSLASDNIIVDADIEDIRDAYARADIFLAPIRIGGGTRLKILEAMASGLPVVSTTVGVEGLEVRDGREVLIADTPQRFAEKIDLLLKNPELRDKIGNAGKLLVSQKYDWKFSVEKLNEIYHSL